jgi:hypothetical protein
LTQSRIKSFFFSLLEIGKGLANFFCKGSDSKYFSLCGPHMVFVATTQLCYCRAKGAIDNMQMNECDCVPIKLYLHAKKFESHIKFIIQKTLFYFCFFPQQFENTRTIISLWDVQKQAAA